MEHDSEPLDESFFSDPQWVAMNGGFIHENNVLFYFAQSPFFDPQSSNSTVFQQAVSDPRFFASLANRQTFEAQLSKIAGVEFVVIHDDLATRVRNESGEMSKVWAIQKQSRERRAGGTDQVTALAMYYIVGDAVYQAPTIAKMVGNRLVSPRLILNPLTSQLSTANSLTRMFSTAATLPNFSVAQGHTYSKPKQPRQSLSLGDGASAPGSPSRSQQQTNPASANDSTAASTSAFLASLSLAHRHGTHFLDESPLAGEPGSFRVTKISAPPGPPQATQQRSVSQPGSSVASPAPASESTSKREGLTVKVAELADPKHSDKPSTPVSGKLKRRRSRPEG